MRNPISQEKKTIGWILFLLYMISLVYFCFFSEEFGRTSHVAGQYRYNIIPFKEIIRFVKYRKSVGFHVFAINVIGNVLAFVPYGFFRPIIGMRKYNFLRTIVWGFLTSLAIEVSQLLVFVGSFDVDDLILNTFGTVIGFLLFRLVHRNWALFKGV